MTMESQTQPDNGKALAEPYINKQELAKRMNKKLRTVDNWMRRGLIPYYKVGRSVLFKWSEVDAHFGRTCRLCGNKAAL